MPVDPVSDGTWIAVNDAGLAMTLLNIYPVPFNREAFLAEWGRYASRGALIPALMECSTLAEASGRAGRIAPERYPPFRLVALDQDRLAEVHVNEGRLVCREPVQVDRPVMFTSSGLGDGVVGPPRRALFAACLDRAGDPASAQDAYHRHSWPERRHLSVCMSRPEARTVSLTVVELARASARLVYEPLLPDQAAEPVVLEMALARSGPAVPL
jgi:hypothetical protein